MPSRGVQGLKTNIIGSLREEYKEYTRIIEGGFGVTQKNHNKGGDK